jgi:DNA-binding NarL/FixJ family response regulator
MTVLTIALIEDDARYRRSVELLIGHTPGLAIAGSFGAAGPALAALADESRPRWDVALVDVDLPDLSGIEVTRRIKARWPDVAVLMLTVFEEPSTMLQAICAGADGYLLKRSTAPELIAAVRAARQGGAPLTAPVARGVLELVRRLGRGEVEPTTVEAPTRVEISTREREVLRCLVDGRTYQETAVALEVQLDTVRTHVRNLYRKLHVNRAAEAVAKALREQLV